MEIIFRKTKQYVSAYELIALNEIDTKKLLHIIISKKPNILFNIGLFKFTFILTMVLTWLNKAN